jgi:hypothetical protein
MAGFTKFNPHTFLEGESTGNTPDAAVKRQALATLAGLAERHPQSRNPPVSEDVVSQVPLKPVSLQLVPERKDTPAKVAKAAKPTDLILDATDLLDRYRERAAIIEYDGGQDRVRAEAMAWNEVAAIWYRQHGTRTRADVCAGCGKTLGDEADVLLLPHGERAGAGGAHACILSYGRRWKREAAQALVEFGIATPSEITAEIEKSKP